MESSRMKILDAAQRVYAEHGFRGATTRRIAETAGVNEVTLFRIFGSKDALLEEAVRPNATRREVAVLTDQPSDPEAELTAWVGAQLAFLRERRSIIRKTMSEIEERPRVIDCVREGPQCAHRELSRYLGALVERGWIQAADLGAAISMLMGAIFSDAMGREIIPENFPQPVAAAPRSYARVFLRAVGLRPDLATAAAARKPAAASSGRRTTNKPDTATR
jgi:AcrR family transcriptional regulator